MAIKLILTVTLKAMINKILIPTDLSINSKTGIRFGIQLASQNKSSLIFYHYVHFEKPTSWSNEKYDSYISNDIESTRTKLFKFINDVYFEIGITKAKFEYIVEQGVEFKESVINYAINAKANFICMSTRGAGRLKKLIGTNASHILTHSPIPVFIIPKTYRRKPINIIMYSSDMNNLNSELKLVKDFARVLKAKILVYHYDYLLDVGDVKKKLLKLVKRFTKPGIEFIFKKSNIEQPFAQNLIEDARKSKASLSVLFTDQKRDWFDKLFLSSKTAEISFESKSPLLVFQKIR